MVTSGVIYHALRALTVPVDIRNICVLLAPAFSGLTAIASYLLTNEMTTSPSAGLLAAAFMGIAPGYISRSVAGSYDNEAIAIFLLVFTFYLWIKALKLGSMLWGALCALFYGYMVSSWGGYAFITCLLPMHAFVLICMGRYSTRLYVSYTTWYALGTLASMQIPFVGFLPVKTSEHMPALGKMRQPHLFIVTLLMYFTRYFWFSPAHRIHPVRSICHFRQAVPDLPRHCSGRYFWSWSPRSRCAHLPRIHCALGWSILLSLGYKLRQNPHSHHRIRL